MKKAVFLDRDGTINTDGGEVYTKDMMKVYDFSSDAIKIFKKLGYLVIVVTNQPCVAKNFCTEQDVNEINELMISQLKGAKIDKIYYCPHHPEKGHPNENPAYKIDCECRKPNTSMIRKATEDFDINLSESFMIGDTTRDIKLGENARIKTVLLKTGYGGSDKKYDVKPDFVSENLLEAAKLIEKLSKISAVILVGGKGERLRPLTDSLPKPMLPINGKPVLEYQIELLKKHGIRKIIICGYYLFDKIKEYFKDGKKFGIEIIYSEEQEPLGSGGAIKNAEHLIEDEFIVFPGDVMTDLDITSLLNFHFSKNADMTIVTRKTDHPQDSDLLEIKDDRLISFLSKYDKNRKLSEWGNTGFFVLNKKILKKIKLGFSIFEKEIPKIIENENVFAYKSNDYIKDMGTLERYEKVKKDMKN